MKIKSLLTLICLMLSSVGFAQDVFEYKAKDLNILAGGTGNVEITLTNSSAICAIQSTMILPEGLSLVAESGTLNSEIINGHSLDIADLGNHKVAVNVLPPTSLKSLRGEGQVLISIPVKADASFTGGTIKLTGIKLVTRTEEEKQTETEVEATVNVVDQTDFALYCEGITFDGEGKGTLSLNLDNPIAIYALQFRLSIPEDVTLTCRTYDSFEEEYVYNIILPRADTHEAACYFNESTRVLGIAIANPNKKNLIDNSGVVASLDIQIDPEKDYTDKYINLTEIILSDDKGNRFEVEGQLIPINTNSDGIKSVNAAAASTAVYNLNGQRVLAPANGVFIQNGKKTVIK